MLRNEAPSHEDMKTPTTKMNVMDVTNPRPDSRRQVLLRFIGKFQMYVSWERWNEELTEHIDSEMSVDWGEETVNEMNKPACEVECDGDWKKNDTI